MKHREIHRASIQPLHAGTKQSGAALQQPGFPGRDLIRMNVELLGQVGQRLFTLESGQCHLRFESQGVVPAGPFRQVNSCSAAILAAFRQEFHLWPCTDFPGHLCTHKQAATRRRYAFHNRIGWQGGP